MLVVFSVRCQALEPVVLHFQTIKTNLFSFSMTGCRPLNSRITSSNDSNYSNITIHTIINQIITRICMALLDQSLLHARSHLTQWPFKWHPMTLRCINRTRSFSRRQMASTWTCISLLAVHATCSMVSMAVAAIISSMELTPIMTPCYSHPANVLRSWINSRTTAKFHRNLTRSRPCKLHPRLLMLMAVLMSPAGLQHPTTPIRLSSKTANYWTAWIRSTTTTRIRPISIIFWSPTKLSQAVKRKKKNSTVHNML